MLTIPTPSYRERRQRGVHATTSGTTVNVRLSQHGREQVRQAAAQLNISIGDFVRQVAESAAGKVCNGEASGGCQEGD